MSRSLQPARRARLSVWVAVAVALVVASACESDDSPTEVRPSAAVVSAAAVSVNLVWARQFGTSVHEAAAFPNGIAVWGDAVFVGGTTGGTLPGQTSAGDHDAYLARFDTEGNLVWTRQFGTFAQDFALAVAAHSTGVYVAGFAGAAFPGQSYKGGLDPYLRKYDAAGNILWTRQFGNSNLDIAEGLAVDEGGVYVSGFTKHTFLGDDVFVRKYNHSGDLLWTNQFGAGKRDHTAYVATDGAGAVYVAGATTGQFPGETSSGGTDVFVRKYTADGVPVWVRQFGSGGPWDHPDAIGADDTGVRLASHVGGSVDVREYDASGALVWTTSPATLGHAFGLVVDAVGATHVSGATATSPRDGSVVKLDASGAQEWQTTFGTAGSESFISVALGEGAIYTAGQTNGTFAGQTAFGGWDAFIARHRVLTPLEVLAALETQVAALAASGVLNAGQSQSLLAKLAAARVQLEQENVAAAANILKAFRNEVEALQKARKLSAAEAAALIGLVDSLLAMLGA